MYRYFLQRHSLQYGLPLFGTGRFVAGIDGYGPVAITARNAGNKRLGRRDLQFEHFNLSHSRRQTNTALKLAPKTSATKRKTGGFWSLNRRSFIQFSISFLSPNWKSVENVEPKIGCAGWIPLRVIMRGRSAVGRAQS